MSYSNILFLYVLGGHPKVVVLEVTPRYAAVVLRPEALAQRHGAPMLRRRRFPSPLDDDLVLVLLRIRRGGIARRAAVVPGLVARLGVLGRRRRRAIDGGASRTGRYRRGVLEW